MEGEEKISDRFAVGFVYHPMSFVSYPKGRIFPGFPWLCLGGLGDEKKKERRKEEKLIGFSSLLAIQSIIPVGLRALQ